MDRHTHTYINRDCYQENYKFPFIKQFPVMKHLSKSLPFPLHCKIIFQGSEFLFLKDSGSCLHLQLGNGCPHPASPWVRVLFYSFTTNKFYCSSWKSQDSVNPNALINSIATHEQPIDFAKIIKQTNHESLARVPLLTSSKPLPALPSGIRPGQGRTRGSLHSLYVSFSVYLRNCINLLTLMCL